MMDRKLVGKRISEIRRARGLNQTEFGEAVGAAQGSKPVSRKTIGNWESGRKGGARANLLYICEALWIFELDFLVFNGPIPPPKVNSKSGGKP
jgi:transcriptional regulator with XRE-family HTH domain